MGTLLVGGVTPNPHAPAGSAALLACLNLRCKACSGEYPPPPHPPLQPAETLCNLAAQHLAAAICPTRSGELGTRAPACVFMVQEMHFKLVPGYPDPGIRHHSWGWGVGVCVERDLITPEKRFHFVPPKRNGSLDRGGLPVGRGAGEERNLGVFTSRFVRSWTFS